MDYTNCIWNHTKEKCKCFLPKTYKYKKGRFSKRYVDIIGEKAWLQLITKPMKIYRHGTRYTNTASTPASKYEYVKRWREKNEEKVKAHRKVYVAMRNGSLKKQRCFCGHKDTQAHHIDYSKPLEVVWLCKLHHVKSHQKSYLGA